MCITRILKNSFLWMCMILGVSHIYAVELNSTNITQSPFNCATGNQVCSLSNKNITSIAPGTFDNHINLRTLDLTYNQLTTLPAGLFDHTPDLIQFAIYANQLTEIPAGLFDYTPILDYFSPALNQLTTLPAGLFDHTPNLRNFNISSNKLIYLPDDLFLNIPAFNSFRIDDNKLTTIPASLTTITNINTLRVANNCMVLSNMSDGSIDYLNAHATDNPLWSTQQDGCSVDYDISFYFVDPIKAGIFNVLQFYIYQYYNNSSTGNYLQIYGLDNVMSFSLTENIGWSSPSLGVYRYDLPDSAGYVSKFVYLSGIVKQSIGNSTISLTGQILTNTIDRYTGNNTIQSSFYIRPTTNYYIDGALIQTGQSGDIKNISINYSVFANNLPLTNSLVTATLGSGLSILSSGWQNAYNDGALLMTGDICYDSLINEEGPYYESIKSYFLSMGYTINNWLVSHYGYSSDSTQEIEHLMDACISHMGYHSFSECINDMGIYITKANYPQCGGPKSFAHTGDICYGDFLQEGGLYYNYIESYIINNYGYSNVQDWLSNDFGLVVPGGDEAESIENLCLTSFGYSTLDQCFLERFNLLASAYSSVCGYDELPSLLIKLLPKATNQFDVQLQLHTNILSGESIISEFNFYPSLLDFDLTNNKLIYTLFPSTITSSISTGAYSFGGGGGTLINPSCPNGNTNITECNNSINTGSDQISFLETDIYNDSIDNGYCYNRKSGLSIIDSVSIETTEEFKKALLFMYSYGLTKNSSIDDYNPNKNLTREQAAKMFANFATNILCRKTNSSLTISYNDFGLADASLQSYITKAFQLGLMKGGSDGNFRPKDFITKAEFNAVMVRMILKTYLPENHSDIWYSEYNKISKSLGIVKYGASSTSLTRTDAALMLFKTYKNHSFSLQNINYNSYVLYNRNNIIPFDDEIIVDEIISNSSSSGDITILSGDINNSTLSGSSYSLIQDDNSDVVSSGSSISTAIHKPQIRKASLYSGSYREFDGGL